MAITAEARTEIITLVVGMFGAAPGASVLSDLVAAKDAGSSLKQIAANIANTVEFKSIYPTFLTNQEFATKFVNNLVGSEVDATNKAAAVTQLTASLNAGATRANVIVDTIAALDKIASTDAVWGKAAAALDNKTAVAVYFSVEKQLSGSSLNELQGVIATIDSTAASVTAKKASIDTTSNPGQTFTLTSGVDIKFGTAGSDTFDGSVNSNGTATLTSVDQLNGGSGEDLLIAGLGTANATIAPKLTSVEYLELIASAATITFDMINSTDVESLKIRNSGNTITVDNLASVTGSEFVIENQAAGATLNFKNEALAGANTVAVTVSGTQQNVATDLTISQKAGADATGVETIALVSSGSNQNFLDSVVGQNAALTSTVKTLNVSGSQSLSITQALATSVTSVNAGTLTGGLTATLNNVSDAVTVAGGSGNDTITLAANTANVNVTTGAGNDTVSFTTGFTSTDSVAGGDGTDTLSVTTANAAAVAATLTTVTGFEALTLNSATAAESVTASRFGSIDRVTLEGAANAGLTLTLAAGSKTVALANSTGTSQITAALTVNDTGTATTDVLALSNGNTTAATDSFNGQAVTINGFETSTISTGTVVTAAQTMGALTIAGDSTSGANVLNVSGINSLTVASMSSNSSGLFTVNASGLTGTAALSMTAGPTFTGGVTGTVSVLGGANSDTLRGHATASSTIDGGAGNDGITGGSAADNLVGGAGNDTLTLGGGNDVADGGDGSDTITAGVGTVSIDGGAGNDFITLVQTLTAGDTIKGGEGTDRLDITGSLAGTAAPLAAVLSDVSGFETLRVSGILTTNVDMVQFTGNSGFTRIDNTAAGANTFQSVASSVVTLGLGGTSTTTLTRLVDTTSNALSVVRTELTAANNVTITALTANDEETLSIAGSTGAGNTVITTLTANDLTTLTLTGSGAGSVEITNAIAGAANLATVTASGVTGNVVVNASQSTANMTFAGSLTGTNALTGGTGSDTITGGTAADTITGGNGADSISGNAGDDVLAGGIGADVITAGIGDDTLVGGAGNDSLTGGEGADKFFLHTTNGVDTIADFLVGTDDIRVGTAQSGEAALLGAVTEAAPITTAGAAQAFANQNVYYVSFNGAAANLTTGGTATLSVADLTATTLTALATYLDERFNGTGTNGHEVVVAVNWTAGGSTSTYIYEHVEANTSAALEAAELTLVGIVSRGTTILTTGDIIA